MLRLGSIVTAAALLWSLPGTAAEADLEAAKKQIRALDVEFCKATIARDKERFVSFLAADAVFFGSSEPKVGKEAIVESWAPYFEEGGSTLTWKPTEAVVFEPGDLGYTSGTYELKLRDAKGNVTTSHGMYHTVWRLQLDGSWKIVSDIGTRPVPVDQPGD